LKEQQEELFLLSRAMSALHDAVKKLDVDEIKRLVADGADLTALAKVRFLRRDSSIFFGF
jgi:hypothetical protein